MLRVEHPSAIRRLDLEPAAPGWILRRLQPL